MFIIYEQVNQQMPMSEAKATCSSLNYCFTAWIVFFILFFTFLQKFVHMKKKCFESQLFSKIIYIDNLFYNEIYIFIYVEWVI